MNMNKKIILLILFGLMFIPSLNVNAKDKKITVYCYCENTTSGVNCPEKCTPEEVEKSIKIECGGRDSEITGEGVKYYCNKQEILWIPFKNSERIGTSPLESCQNYVSNTSVGEVSMKVTATATCNPVAEVLGEYICEEEDVLKALTFVGYILFFAKLLVPFLIILFGTIDFFNAVTAEKKEELDKKTKKFIKRIIAGLLVFFVPTIISAFISILSNYSDTVELYENCVSCALDPISCNK